MKTNKGFTLVELLVVIAIIVTLASIVLVGIQSATKRAKDARIIADMSQVRSQIELTKDTGSNNGVYTFVDADLTEENVEINTLFFDIRKQLGLAATVATSTFVSSINASAASPADPMTWCVRVTLVEKTSANPPANIYYCIDSTGKAGKTESATVCAGTVYNCGTVN